MIEKVASVIRPICKQSRGRHASITGYQVGERHRPRREQGLAPFFQTNDDGQKQANGQDEADGALFWEQTQGTFIQQ